MDEDYARLREALDRFKEAVAHSDSATAWTLYRPLMAEFAKAGFKAVALRAQATAAMMAHGHWPVDELPVRTPNQSIRDMLGGVDWSSDAPDGRKAYILACFSELAYLRRSRFDLDGERFDFIPSEALDALLTTGATFDLQAIFDALEVRVEYVDHLFFTYAIAHFGPFVIVAVRGTKGASDWLIDLDANALRGDHPDYHAGFFREAAKGQAAVAPRLIGRSGVPVYVTGHSLGGAAAAIMAQLAPWRTAYTFGAPRFGNAAAVEQRRPYAYVRPSDLVPHLPPRALGYADAEAALRPVCDEAPVQASLFKTLRDWLPAGRRFAVQHSVEGYRSQLGHAIGQHFPEAAYIHALRQKATKT